MNNMIEATIVTIIFALAIGYGLGRLHEWHIAAKEETDNEQ